MKFLERKLLKYYQIQDYPGDLENDKDYFCKKLDFSEKNLIKY